MYCFEVMAFWHPSAYKCPFYGNYGVENGFDLSLGLGLVCYYAHLEQEDIEDVGWECDFKQINI